MTRLSLGRPRPLSFQAKLSYCVNHFEGIRFNNPFQGSFEHRQLQFDIAKFRLHRWGEAVTQYQNDHTISESDPNSQIALATLDGLLGAFDAIKMTAKRREFHITRGTPLTLKDHLHKDLHDWFMKVTTRTPTQHSTTGNQMCTLYQDSDAKRLLVDITTLIEELEQLFPVDKISLKLAQSAIDTIGNQPDTFRLLGSTAAGTDEVLGEAVRGKLGYFSGRNHVNKIERDGAARVHIGNTWSRGALGHARKRGSGSTVNSAGHITAKGASMVQVGDQYGTTIFRK